MNKVLTWFSSLIAALVPLLLKAEDSNAKGQDKKAQVVSEILVHLKDPNVPLDIPTWLPESVLGWILGMLVDVLVAQLNKISFFQKL